MRLLLLVIAVTAASPALADSCKETPALKARAKITCAQARSTALAKVPNGKVKEAELEEEHGKLVYSFDIATKGRSGVDEVQVDAQTGAVVSVEHEDAKSEAAEKKADHQ